MSGFPLSVRSAARRFGFCKRLSGSGRQQVGRFFSSETDSATSWQLLVTNGCGASGRRACMPAVTASDRRSFDRPAPLHLFPLVKSIALPKACLSQPSVSARSLATACREAPFFLSALNPHASRPPKDDLLPGLFREEVELSSASPLLSLRQPGDGSRDALEAGSELSGQQEGLLLGSADVQRLQQRYDLLLSHPEAFNPQVQLLQRRIQQAQQLHIRQPHMRELRPLQDQLRTPRSGACWRMKPVVYAAFCIYSPSCIHINAAARVGAAAHFLQLFLKSRSMLKRQKKTVKNTTHFANGFAGVEQWLEASSLQNICVYPLEALSPKVALFRLSAPPRIAAWEDILSGAVSS